MLTYEKKPPAIKQTAKFQTIFNSVYCVHSVKTFYILKVSIKLFPKSGENLLCVFCALCEHVSIFKKE
jgi:hypothetical protein